MAFYECKTKTTGERLGRESEKKGSAEKPFIMTSGAALPPNRLAIWFFLVLNVDDRPGAVQNGTIPIDSCPWIDEFCRQLRLRLYRLRCDDDQRPAGTFQSLSE